MRPLDAIVGGLIGLAVVTSVPNVRRAFWPTCIIVTDGTRDTYEHELAHCNGWQHPEFAEAHQPARYVRPYWPLEVHVCPGLDCKSPAQLCMKLRKERGLVNTKGWRNVVGCSIREG